MEGATNPTLPSLLTLREVADVLRVSYWSAWRLVRAGRLRATYVGPHSPRVFAADVAALIDESVGQRS